MYGRFVLAEVVIEEQDVQSHAPVDYRGRDTRDEERERERV